MMLKIYIYFLLLFSMEVMATSEQQKELESTICDTKWGYLEQTNIIKKNKFVNERKKRLSILFEESLSIKDWTGIIRDIDIIDSNFVYLNISIDCNVNFKTWNNKFSDFSDNTLIDINSKIANKLSNFSIGDKVIFSGNLIQDPEKVILESSLTLDGRMTNPEYIIHFKNIYK